MSNDYKTIDNKFGNTVHEEIRNNVDNGTDLFLIMDNFTIFAYESLQSELKDIKKFRFLFSKPSFMTNQTESFREYDIREDSNSVVGNKYELELTNQLEQSAIARDCSKWIEEKAEFRAFKQSSIINSPAVILIDNINSKRTIMGSIDFSLRGLGLKNTDSMILTQSLGYDDVFNSHIQTFRDYWSNTNKVVDVTQNVLNQINSVYKENSAEFLYFLSLYNIFYNQLDELDEDAIMKKQTGIQDTMIWNMLYTFQRDGAIGAIDKLEKYNGVILADSVGLGKTFTALAVIKYYELRNDRVLVLAPKKLRDNWNVYTLNDKRNILVNDRFNYDVLNHTDLSRYNGHSGDIDLSTINWSNYDLIVIDESHNFRNNNPVKGKVTRYERLMDEVIKSGVKTKVMMLSATPVNNKMNDIKNQIAFITEDNNTALNSFGIDNIDSVLRNAQRIFNMWSILPDNDRTTEKFVDMMDLNYFKLLDLLTIARSRKHIEKYYDVKEIGHFPERLKPINKYSSIDIKNRFPEIKDVNELIRHLFLAIYSPMSYVRLSKRQEYEEKYDIQVKDGKSTFKQIDRESSIVNLMRVNILKRLESSIESFKITVKKILDQTKNTISRIDAGVDFDKNLSILDVEFDDELLDDELVGNKVKVLLQDIDTLKWRKDLMHDAEQLQKLYDAALLVKPENDKKLNDMFELIVDKMENPINPNNKKVVIFTAFADTADYLFDNLSPMFKEYGINSAIVKGSGANRTTLDIKSFKTTDMNNILTLFSPRSKDKDKIFPEIQTEIDVLIATDCISEGQNLQDCDFLINYDIHWNPVRIIQRFGRIDRIGSTNKQIQLVNFWPTSDLNEYINLEQRVQGRMVLLDVSATGEENVLEDDSKEMTDLKYRRNQLEKLQEEVVDLEEISDAISITDLTFNDFKIELMEYMKNNERELATSPKGLNSIVTIPEDLSQHLEAGVIFILKYKNEELDIIKNNPLKPFYVMYISDDGEIICNYAQAKIALDYYKKIALENKQINDLAVNSFNKRTNNGINMSKYSELLDLAINEITGENSRAGVDSLFSRGGTTLNTGTTKNDFELLSFLIIEGDKNV